MKKCLPSIVSAALCLSLVMTPFVPVAAAYADEGSPAESSEIYVGDNYDENYDISLFERGRCTDSYSKAWCDPYLAGTAEVIAGLVTTGPGGGLFATAMTSYRLFTYMF